MKVTNASKSPGAWSSMLAVLGCAVLASGCGGGSGGSGSGDTLPGLVLVNFVQSGQDNVPLNRTLEFRFSSPIDPASVGPASIQVRRGPEYGASVDGNFVVQAERVFFEPRLPGLCDLSDSGLQPATEYRVTLIGSPEEFSIRSLTGEPLQATITASFSTRPDTDPELFEDQLPGLLPVVESTNPADGAFQVAVDSSNKVEILFSENVNPCSVDDATITLFQYATGDLSLGFVPAFDAAPSDKFSWGSGTPTLPPRRILCAYDLQQNLLATKLTLTPNFGEFPDNALLVCQVSNQVKDFGGNPLVPYTFAFTTQNRPPQTKARVFEFDGDVPIITADTTAEVNTARAPSRAQGYLLVSGDGDNGTFLLQPSGPDASKGPDGCNAPYFQPNDSVQDDFDPLTNVLLSTGATPNTCKNAVDGSSAVTFEFRTFRIRNGVTVRLTGVNPAIILVRGDVVIEAGGRLLARGDGQLGQPSGAGNNGASQSNTATPAGGVGLAGGGSGGQVSNSTDSLTALYGGNGWAGFGSEDYGVPAGVGGATTVLVGPGRGAVSSAWVTSPTAGNRHAPSAGGGGHGKAGVAGTALGTGSSPITLQSALTDGAAGGIYGADDGTMPTPEAGSGGGAGGNNQNAWSGYTSYLYYSGTGGAGGAGGGFVDITSSADIRVFGSIDANGGRGGNGVGGYAFYVGGGGGGGGAGGGIRLLTPSNIIMATGASLSAIGGVGGAGHPGTAAPVPPVNNGGAGGVGRLTLEDSDGVIEGIGGATVNPSETSNTATEKVFYRGPFNGARFKGGGLRPSVTTDLIDAGPFSPDYIVPDQDYGAAPGAVPPAPRMDFVAGVPNIASRGIGKASMFIEIQGYPSNADGTPNLLLPSGWKSVGTFLDSGAEPFPTWVPNAKPNALDVPPGDLLPGNTGDGIDQIDGMQFMQFRITFFLPNTVGPFDPGPYIDRWSLWLTYDQ